MVNILERIKKAKGQPRSHRESGNTLVLYIGLFPVALAFFGLSIDATLAAYTQTTLQSNLDAATQSALSRAVNPGSAANPTSNPLLTPDQARNLIIDTYSVNRNSSKEQPFVICQTNSANPSNGVGIKYTKLTSSGVNGCAWTEGNYEYVDTNGQLTVKMTIVEQSRPVFLQVLKIDTFNYVLTSEARVTYAKG